MLRSRDGLQRLHKRRPIVSIDRSTTDTAMTVQTSEPAKLEAASSESEDGVLLVAVGCPNGMVVVGCPNGILVVSSGPINANGNTGQVRSIMVSIHPAVKQM